ncbi:MAG: DNA polymerase III subunit gamma/tau [Clostridia bacterium]|nr:DNA polymerase III subunit gamma/tau [Clostridia bacterium]
MAYQALYRQWRPADFSSMVGQETVIKTLRNQVASGRIAHAYLFCGSRGTGKTSTAKIMARAVNCEHPDHGDPCGECESCRRLLGEESLDVLEIDAASNNGVDEIRDLRETVKYPPQYGRYKVYIIDEVHMLSTSAFNALLKTLEEPPNHVVFILATTEPQKLPATILSRCQRFDFGRIPAQQIVDHLREVTEKTGAQADEDALHMIARAAEGGMRDALSILDMCLGYENHVTGTLVHNVLGTADRAFLFRFGDALQNADASTLMFLIDELMRSGREPIVFAKDVSQHLRALLMGLCCADDLSNLLEITKEDADEYIGQAQGFTQTRLMRMMDLFMAVETELRSCSSPRLALEKAALKACLRTNEADAQALSDRIEELETQLAQLTEKIKSGAIAVSAAPQQKQAASAEGAAPAPAAEKPKSIPKADGTAEGIWKAAMTEFSKADPGLFAQLKMGKLISGKDNQFLWMGKDVFVNMMNADNRRTVIANTLTQIAGSPCTFKAVTEQQASTVSADAQSSIDILRETFGAENVIVQAEAKG